jgi:hypothetical protein
MGDASAAIVVVIPTVADLLSAVSAAVRAASPCRKHDGRSQKRNDHSYECALRDPGISKHDGCSGTRVCRGKRNVCSRFVWQHEHGLDKKRQE